MTAAGKEINAGVVIANRWAIKAKTLLAEGKLPLRLANMIYWEVVFEIEVGELRGLAATAARHTRVAKIAYEHASQLLDLEELRALREYFEKENGGSPAIYVPSADSALFDLEGNSMIAFHTNNYPAVKARAIQLAGNHAIKSIVISAGTISGEWEVVPENELSQDLSDVASHFERCRARGQWPPRWPLRWPLRK